MAGSPNALRLLLAASRRPEEIIARQRLCSDCLRASARRVQSRRTLTTVAHSSTSPSIRSAAPRIASRTIRTPLPISTRSFATVQDSKRGPLAEYDRRVSTGRLRNDEHQRGETGDPIQAVHSLTACQPQVSYRFCKTSTTCYSTSSHSKWNILV